MDPLTQLYLMLLRRIQEGGRQLPNGAGQFGMPQIPDENPPVFDAPQFDAVGFPPVFLPPALRRRPQVTRFYGA